MSRARDLAAFVSNADGDIKFDTDTLFIDSSENRVGIGNTAPDTMIHGLNATAPVLKLERDSTSLANNNIIGEVRMSHKDSNDAGDSVRIIGRAEGTAGAAGLAFTTGTPSGGSERMRISADGNIGLNETNPTADIHMTKADDINEIIMDANRPNAGQLIGRHRFYWNGTEVARMEGDAGSDTTNKDDGYLRFLARASGSSMAEKLRIDSDGLKFNGDSAASNALDDYEEGTFSPMSSTKAEVYHARYTKIGNLVTINCAFSMKSGQSQDYIALPFVPSNDGAGKNVATNTTTNNRYAGTVSFFENNTSVTNLMLFHQGNQGANAYFIAQTGSQQWPEAITDTEYNAVAVSFTYQTG